MSSRSSQSKSSSQSLSQYTLNSTKFLDVKLLSSSADICIEATTSTSESYSQGSRYENFDLFDNTQPNFICPIFYILRMIKYLYSFSGVQYFETVFLSRKQVCLPVALQKLPPPTFQLQTAQIKAVNLIIVSALMKTN